MIKPPQTISILGCGWVGLPLATDFVRSGHLVKGSATNGFTLEVLKKSGVEGHLVNFSESQLPSNELLDCDILIITIPPGKSNGEEKSLELHRKIVEFASKSRARTAIYTSSTSAYSDEAKLVTEVDSPTDNLTVKLENLYRDKIPNLIIVRFGGLYGPNRNPGKFLAGKTGLQKPNAPINMTHLEDAIQGISCLATSDKTGIYNVVAPIHPSREEFYTAQAQKENLTLPVFDKMDITIGKIVSSEKLINEFNFKFIHPDPMC